jgi:hypothetical protein
MRRLPGICALLGTSFHVLTVVAMLLVTGGQGEGQAFWVALLDFPLILLLEAVPSGARILYNSVPAYIWIFSVVGTLMYAAVGYCVGVLLRFLIGRFQ